MRGSVFTDFNRKVTYAMEYNTEYGANQINDSLSPFYGEPVAAINHTHYCTRA